MNRWSFDTFKHYETEMQRRAQEARIASDAASSAQTTGTPHPIVAWVGERLIEVGERLTSVSAQPELPADCVELHFAESAR